METPVYYFEPNNIEYNAEDLCLGIALEVQYMSRSLVGSKSLNGSVDIPLHQNILYADKTKNVLTTSYTDITLLELEGGGNKESIGIENISIKYNSWNLPQVTIKFVDVRGNAIFNPQELMDNENGKTDLKGSFLRGFFDFPYPIFKLTVKGYFGKPVTYRLIVKGVPQAQFNSETGNFEMTVEFIGHMYYYLTDIPMSLVMTAPYIKYGGVNSIVYSHDRKELPTFVNFIQNTSDAMVKLSQNIEYTNITKEKEKNKKISETLIIIRESINKIQSNITKYWDVIDSYPEAEQIKIKINADKLLIEKRGIEDVIEELSINLKKIKEEYKKNSEYNIPDLVIEKNTHFLNKKTIAIGDYIYLKVNFERDLEAINKKIQDLEIKRERLLKEEEEIFRGSFKNAYGYIPTIKNVFEISIGHLEKLRENIHRCMEEISSETPNRRLDKLKDIYTDIPEGNNVITTYPFTGFFNSEGEHTWIGYTAASTYTETDFINQVYRNMSEYKQQMTDAEVKYFLNKQFSYDTPPDGIYALMTDIQDNKKNEYANELEKRCKGNLVEYCNTNNKEKLPEALNVFVERYVRAMLTVKHEDYLRNDFPKIEAYKLLACGWDDKVYKEDTLWGREGEVPYKEIFRNTIEQEIKKIVKDTERVGAEVVYTDTRTVEKCSGLRCLSRRDAKYEITIRNFENLGLSQVYIEDENLKIEYYSRGDENMDLRKEEFIDKTYIKLPLKIDTFSLEKENAIENSVSFLKERGVSYSNIFSPNKMQEECILHNREIKTFLEILKDYESSEDEICKIIPVSDTGFELEKFNKGGIISFNKGFLFKMLSNYANEIIVDDKTDKNINKIIFTRIEELTHYYEVNKSEFVETLRSIGEGGYNDSTIENFKNIFEEEVKFIFPFYLEDGIFSISIGKNSTEKLLGVDTVGSVDITKNMLYDFYAESPLAINTFINTIREYVIPRIKKQNELKGDEGDIEDINENGTQKLALYDIFKNLYDRWKFGAEDFNIIYNNSLDNITINDFVFRDVFNNDIGDDLEVNIDGLIGLLFKIYKGEKDMSLYEFFFEVAKDANCLMIALPCNTFDSFNSSSDLKKMFTPYQYSEVIKNPIKSSFVITYRHKDSQHLNYDSNESSFKDDGIDFIKYVSKGNNGNGIGVFGVTYSLSKQSFFKNIQSSMDKPKVTEQSIASTLSIAESGAKNASTNYGTTSHNLWDVYSQHSYHCAVETMGNAQIMPMMYFQLNNIPLFKGGYLITSVEHTIDKSGMKTTFKGNRLSRNQMPLKEKSSKIKLNIEDNDNNQNFALPQTQSITTKNVNSNAILSYTKDNTVIVIYAGYSMEVPNHESPDLNDFMQRNFIKGNRGGLFTERDDILQPYAMINNKEKTVDRYREYWGNRKIANALYEKLEANGYIVKKAFFNKKNAQEMSISYSTFKEEGKKLLAICIYSNESRGDGEVQWGTNNEWQIFTQNEAGEYNDKTQEYEFTPYANVSKVLAQCIAGKMSIALSGNTDIEVNTNPQINNTGVKWEHLTKFNAPTVLSKNLFHTTKEHVKFLSYKNNRDIIAQAHFDGIEQFFERMKGKNNSTTETPMVINEKISKYFTLSEFTKTSLFKYKNIPNEGEKQNIASLANKILDKVRERYGEEIIVTSGYRCEELNDELKGSPTSQHKTGSAADIQSKGNTKNEILFWCICDLIDSGEIEVGQLIWEYGTLDAPAWIHVSLPNAGKRNKILRIDREDGTGKKLTVDFDLPRPS